MKESQQNPEEIAISITVAPFFFENLTSFPLLQAERIRNNRFLSSFFKHSQMKSLENLYSSPEISFKSRASSTEKPPKAPKLHEIYEKFAKNPLPTDFYAAVVNENAVDLDPNATKCVISADLSSAGDFKENSLVLLLNNEWLRRKKLEEIAEKAEKARLFRENLRKQLTNPDFKRISQEIARGYEDFMEKYNKKLGFHAFDAENRAKVLRKRMKHAMKMI